MYAAPVGIGGVGVLDVFCPADVFARHIDVVDIIGAGHVIVIDVSADLRINYFFDVVGLVGPDNDALHTHGLGLAKTASECCRTCAAVTGVANRHVFNAAYIVIAIKVPHRNIPFHRIAANGHVLAIIIVVVIVVDAADGYIPNPRHFALDGYVPSSPVVNIDRITTDGHIAWSVVVAVDVANGDVSRGPRHRDITHVSAHGDIPCIVVIDIAAYRNIPCAARGDVCTTLVIGRSPIRDNGGRDTGSRSGFDHFCAVRGPIVPWAGKGRVRGYEE
jgi:hypothetical protein